MTVRAYVHRKIRDLVQFAAEDSLARTYPTVRGVQRTELWTFQVTGEDGAAAVRSILEDSTLVVNPNIHRYELDEPRLRETDAATRLTVIVRDSVDARGAAVLRTIRERRGIRSITGVERAIHWTVDLEETPERAGSIGQEITGGEGRGAGCLANRHSQEVEVHVERRGAVTGTARQ